MYSLLPVISIVSFMVMAFSLTMAVPLAFSWLGNESSPLDHAMAMAVTFASGLAIWLATRRFKRELQPRDGFLLVALVWSVLPAFATLPLLMHVPHMSFTDAYFEAMSGITTTGGTVMTGLDMLPLSIMNEYLAALRSLVAVELKLFRDGVIKRAPAGKVQALTTNATELSERLVVLIRRKLLLPTLHALVASDGKPKRKRKR